MRIELQILKNLTRNEEYHRKVIPFIKNEYFTEPSDEIVFDLIKNYFSRYNSLPVVDQLRTEFDDMDGVGEMTARAVMDVFEDISRGDADNQSWITDQTEGFCKDRALFNAIKTSLSIMNGDTKQDRGGIPKILQDALAVTFDPSVGHDYLEEYEDQLEYYNRVEEKLPFDIELINKITNNGLSKKTLTIILGGVHAGKTLTMCHFSAAHLNLGKKVLYISLEMSEHEIVRRIDSNLLDIPINELEKIPKNMYESKMNKLRSRCRGKLIVKEYPTGGANVNHFRALLNELKLKKNFVPDVVYVDYLNICSSSRYKAGASGMYEYVKSISEELRGLAVENDFRVITATQLNRKGFCLALDSDILMADGSTKKLSQIQRGNTLKGSNHDVQVQTVFETTKKKQFLIRTKSGKIIKCSDEHRFPTSNGEVCSIKTGLKHGVKLLVKK